MKLKTRIDKEIEKLNGKNLGHVYVLECPFEDTRLIKIGKSKNWAERFKSHKTSNPLIKYVKHYVCDMKAEKILHRLLRKYLHNGSTEWFVDDGTLLNAIDVIMMGFPKPDDINRKDIADRMLQIQDAKGWRVFKFKSIYNNGFVFVVSNNVLSAKKFVLKHLGLKVTHVSSRKLSEVGTEDTLLDQTYIYYNNIPLPKFKLLDDEFKRERIDYNKTGRSNRVAMRIKSMYK